VGGFECYIEAEEEAVAEASDVFRMDDDDGPLLQVSLHKMKGSFDRVYGSFDRVYGCFDRVQGCVDRV